MTKDDKEYWQVDTRLQPILKTIQDLFENDLNKTHTQEKQDEVMESVERIWDLMHAARLCICERTPESLILSLMALMVMVGLKAEQGAALVEASGNLNELLKSIEERLDKGEAGGEAPPKPAKVDPSLN